MYKRFFSFPTFSYIWLSFCFFSVFLIVAIYGPNWINADDSSELILSHILSKEGKLITDSWYYSTELRVLNTQIIWAFLFRFFDDWYIVRIVGTFVCYVIYLLSYVYFANGLRINKNIVLFSASFIFVPITNDYFNFVLRGVYYIPHISISFFTCGLFIRILNNKSYLLLIAAPLSFIAGCGGLRQIAVLYIPLFITSFVLAIKEYYSNYKDFNFYKNFVHIKVSFIFLLLSLFGYIFNSKVLKEYFVFHVYKPLFSKFSFLKCELMVSGLFSSLGFVDGKSLFSSALIINFVSFIILFITIFSIFNISKQSNKIYKYFSVFFVCSILLFFAIYIFSTMDYASRYFLPITIFIIPMLALQYQLSIHNLSKVCIIILSIMVIVCGILNCRTIIRHNPQIHDKSVAEFLVKNNIYVGFSTFWSSNNIVEHSNGLINAICFTHKIIKDNNDAKLSNRFKWLQKKSYDDIKIKDKFYILLTNDEFKCWKYSKNLSLKNLVLENEKYKLFIFNNFESLQEELYSSPSQDSKIEKDVKYTFFSTGTGIDILHNGWSLPESWGTWSNADKARLVFHSDETLPSHIEMDLNVLLAGNHNQQRMRPMLNGVALQEIVLRNNQELISLDISKAVKQGRNHLVIELPDAISPKELGINSDGRTLAIGLKSLRFVW